MPFMTMDHENDPKAKILSEIGDLSSIELFNNDLLLAVYIRPNKTKKGIYLSDQYVNEDQYQSKVGLLLKQGPKSFEKTEEGWFDGCERIFKVSGRYTLTEKFNTADYENDIIGDKYVVSKRMLSQFAHGITGIDQQYMLRVYSFGANRQREFLMLLEDMINHMQERVSVGGYIDIEHLWNKFLPRDAIIEFDRTGVKGLVAPNGTFIEN